MKNIETKCITHAPTLLSHKGSAAWAIALKLFVMRLDMLWCRRLMKWGDTMVRRNWFVEKSS